MKCEQVCRIAGVLEPKISNADVIRAYIAEHHVSGVQVRGAQPAAFREDQSEESVDADDGGVVCEIVSRLERWRKRKRQSYGTAKGQLAVTYK
jgi:hypothetical protein